MTNLMTHPVSSERVPAGYWNNWYNQRKFMDSLGAQLDIAKLDDWYRYINRRDLGRLGMHGLFAVYGSSLSRILYFVYPEHTWQPWRFDPVPFCFWDDPMNRMQYFEWLSEKLQISNPNEWGRFSDTDIADTYHGGGLFTHYDSLMSALMSDYPDYSWQPWIFGSVPKSCWENPSFRKAFLEWFEQKHDIQTYEKWYEVPSAEVALKGGNGLIQLYGACLYSLLSDVHVNFNWQFWRFVDVHEELWESLESKQLYFEWLASELDIKCPEQWYNVMPSKIAENFGRHLLSSHPSLELLLTQTYPDYRWNVWLFKDSFIFQHLWEDMDSVRAYFDWLAVQMDIPKLSLNERTPPEAWYDLRKEDIVNQRGGASFMKFFNSSFIKAVMIAYPNYQWEMWKFGKVPKGFWENEDNVQAYINWLKERLDIFGVDDLFTVTTHEIAALGGYGVIHKLGGLNKLLIRCFPHYADAIVDHSTTTPQQNHAIASKAQRQLRRTVQQLFQLTPEDIQMNVVLPQVINRHSHTIKSIELDVYVPLFRIAFEYQGEQHFFRSLPYGSPVAQQKRDQKKVNACKRENISLIQVPFWWDKQHRSLSATIYAHRSDVLDCNPDDSAIPSQMPPDVAAQLRNRMELYTPHDTYPLLETTLLNV